MAISDAALTALRSLNRTVHLAVYRTSTPAPGADFFVTKNTNGVVITDLRVKFNIRRDLSKHPNACDIEIYNLAEQTRAALETKPLFVELSAGYDGVNRLLFQGDVIFARSKQEKADWVTMLQVADGVRASASARTSRSYGAGTTVKTVVRDVLKSMGQDLPQNLAVSRDLDAQFATGVVTSGAAAAELSRLLAPYGYGWSFQNGRIQILKDEESRNDVLRVSEDTGMVGTPEFGQPSKSGKPPHMTVEMLLRPDFTPGGKVEIQSRAVNSGKPTTFAIKSVKNDGDTHSDEWFTKIEIKPL